MALLFAALPPGSNLGDSYLECIFLSSYAFMPPGFHLVARFFWESLLDSVKRVCFAPFFRQARQGGYGKVMQVLMPGVAFGLAHAGYLNQGLLPWLGIMLPTAFLGMMWGIAYLLGRRSLLPVVVAHFLNDATALPWIAFFMITGSLGRI